MSNSLTSLEISNILKDRDNLQKQVLSLQSKLRLVADGAADATSIREFVDAGFKEVMPGVKDQYDGFTFDSVMKGDWASIHSSLTKALEHISKDGTRHSWLDGAISIAKSRSEKPIPDAFFRLGFESTELLVDQNDELQKSIPFRYEAPSVQLTDDEVNFFWETLVPYYGLDESFDYNSNPSRIRDYLDSYATENNQQVDAPKA